MTLRDNFDRADGALGSNWTALVGTNPYSIISNVAASNGASAENCTVYNAFTPADNQWAEVTVTQTGADAYVGPAVRGSGTSWYIFYGDTGNRALYRIVSGTPTSLASSATGFAVNDVIRLEVEGTTLRAYVNGVLWTSVTDSSLASGSTGMATWSTSTSGRVNNFTADNLTTDQNITAQLIASGEVIYQPTVTPGAVTVTANLIASVEQVYQPSVYLLASARPTSTVSAGSWTDQAGGTTNLHSPLADEDNATYIQSELAPSASVCEVLLETLSDPGTNAAHSFVYRYDKYPPGGPRIDLTVQLRQGTSTLIAAQTLTNVSDTINDGVLAVSEAEAGNITDRSDLRLRFITTQV
jgi:hypothetical protein